MSGNEASSSTNEIHTAPDVEKEFSDAASTVPDTMGDDQFITDYSILYPLACGITNFVKSKLPLSSEDLARSDEICSKSKQWSSGTMGPGKAFILNEDTAQEASRYLWNSLVNTLKAGVPEQEVKPYDDDLAAYRLTLDTKNSRPYPTPDVIARIKRAQKKLADDKEWNETAHPASRWINTAFLGLAASGAATACGITGSFPISLGLFTAVSHLAMSTCVDNESGKTGPLSASPSELWKGLKLGVKKDWPSMCILTKAARDLYKKVGSLTRES